jgi:2'-5' RNA ligase
MFFALWPDAETRVTLSGEDKTLFGGNGGKLVPADEFHLTVRYLGHVGEAQVPQLVDLGARAARSVAASMVELDAVEWWKEAQVLVRVARTTPEPLLRLDEALLIGLKSIGMPTDLRPLKLHLTLVRSVRPHPLGTGPCLPLAWPADALSLIASPGKSTRYEVLAQWPFGGAPVG